MTAYTPKDQDSSSGHETDPSTLLATPPQQENLDGSSGNATTLRKKKMPLQGPVVRLPGAIPKQRPTQPCDIPNVKQPYMGLDQQVVISGQALTQERLHKANHRNQHNGSNEKEEHATGLTAFSSGSEFSCTSSKFSHQCISDTLEDQDSSSGHETDPSASLTTPPRQEDLDGSSGNATTLRKEKLPLQGAVVRSPGAIPKQRPTQPHGTPSAKEPYMRWNQQEVTVSAELLERERLPKANLRNQQNGSNENKEFTTGLTALRFGTEFSQPLSTHARATTPKLTFVTGCSSHISAGSQDTGSTGHPAEQDDDLTVENLHYKIEFLMKELEVKSHLCDSLQVRVSTVEQHYKECKDQRAFLREENKQLRQRNIDLMSLEAESQQMIGKLHKMHDWKQEECHNWQKMLNQKKEEYHQLQEECHQLKEQLTTLRREVKELRENVRLQGPEWVCVGDITAQYGARSDCSAVSSGSTSGELGDRACSVADGRIGNGQDSLVLGD